MTDVPGARVTVPIGQFGRFERMQGVPARGDPARYGTATRAVLGCVV